MYSRIIFTILFSLNCFAVSFPATEIKQGGNPLSATNPLSVRLTDGSSYLSSVPVTGTFWPTTQPVSGTLSAIQSGSWSAGRTWSLLNTTDSVNVGNFPSSFSISNFPATQPVSIATMPSTPVTGTFWQTTQPVSGPLTDTQLRASAVPTAPAQATAANLNAQVVGNIASGSADSGNPVKVGAKYNLTLPTFTDGQRADLQTDANGKLIITQPQTTASGTITSTQNVELYLDGHHSAGVEITGAWTGTLVFEGLIGATWNTIDFFALSTELVGSSTTTNGIYSSVNTAGMSKVRVRGNTVASGTANIVIGGNNSNFNYAYYAREQGATVGSYGVQMGGVDAISNTFQFQHVNALGAAAVYLESSNKAAYKATITPVTPPATPTDIVTLYGSATKTVRITKITLGSTQTTPGINDWYLVKRSTANTGGTSTTITSVPLDSTFPAATAVMRRYTANPTALGTLVGNLSIENILSPSASPTTAATNYAPHTWDFTNNPLVLRGVTEGVAINFNGAALPPGLSVNIVITFTEE